MTLQSPRSAAGRPPAPTSAVSRAVLGAVILVSSIAPLATDMYVPAFPAVEHDLGTSAALVQLTLTTFFIGMATGQLVGGPVSDSRGRRRLLLGSLAVLTVASLACAFAPTIAAMLVARAVQGLSGGWAMVIARSIIVDLSTVTGWSRPQRRRRRQRHRARARAAHGRHHHPARALAAVVLGGGRVSALMLVAVAVGVPESLPPARRHGGGLAAVRAPCRQRPAAPSFLAFLLTFGVSMGVTFAYVATSAFILQSMNGLSPIVYSVDFAANAVGLMAATLLAARIAPRSRPSD